MVGLWIHHTILQMERPYSKAEVELEDMCNDENFYFGVVDGSLKLDENHPYYHQVQLQLYVSTDRTKWCDYCVFTL